MIRTSTARESDPREGTEMDEQEWYNEDEDLEPTGSVADSEAFWRIVTEGFGDNGFNAFMWHCRNLCAMWEGGDLPL